MAIPTTDLDIGTRYALQEDFNNGFVGRDRQVVIQTDDPKGYRPVIMDGTTQGGKSKVALLTDLSDYVPVDTYNSEKAGFATKGELSSYETTDHASTTYATKSEVTSGLASKQPVGDYATTTALTEGLATKLGATAKAVSAGTADTATKATQDSLGNVISSTYATKTEVTSGLSEKLGKTEKATSANTADAVAWSGVTGKPSFATVATTGSYNDLTDKPSISSGEAYITEAWNSGCNWYRVWSNGCIEQGGFASSTAGSSTAVVSLYKAYPNTNYNILLTPNSELLAYVKTIQTAGFYAYADTNYRYVTVYWYTIGWGN